MSHKLATSYRVALPTGKTATIATASGDTVPAGLSCPFCREADVDLLVLDEKTAFECESGACAQARDLATDDRIAHADYRRGLCFLHRQPTVLCITCGTRYALAGGVS